MAQALTAAAGGPGPVALEPAAIALTGRRTEDAGTGPPALERRPVLLRPGVVPRPRLVRQLIEARDLPVALIVAPAGYGKTTLLSEWASVDERPFAWVTLGPEDDDPGTLLSAIALGLDAVEPVGWEIFEALSSGLRNAATVALRRLTRRLGRSELQAVLVLDGLEAVRASEARQVVTAIWQACGGGLQLVLASRSDEHLPVARLRAHGQSVELRTRELAMTRSEAAALLQLAGLDVAPEHVLALTRRTEGWPAGLHMAALSLHEQAGGPDTAHFSGADRFVTEYVRDEILTGLSVVQREFVIRTSVLDRLSAASCNAILGRDDSADVLARLARENVMLVPLDRRDSGYRYHELFAGALRAELHRLEPEIETLVHRRASAWYASSGDVARAIDHALDGRDVQRAAGLLWENSLPYLSRGRERALWTWLDRVTEEALADTPLLALVAGAASLRDGNLDETDRWTTLARSVPDYTDAVQGGIAIMRAAVGRRGIAEMGEDAARAGELLDERSPWRALSLFLRGVADHLSGDPDGARVRLEHAAHLAAVPAPLVQALCLSQLALIAAEGDDPERASVLAARARAQTSRCGLDGCPIVALVFAVSSEMRARCGQVSDAESELRQALRLLERITDPSPWYEAECRIVAARATLHMSGTAAAGELLAGAGIALRRTPDASTLSHWLDEATAQVELSVKARDGADWSLTAAELRVLRYLPSHLSFPEIGERLYVSTNTVKTHVRGIYRKLAVTSRSTAVERARAAGILEQGGNA